RDVAPAKRLQIRALANAQLYNGESRRRRAGQVLFPLLAQPVVELCLAIPSYMLAGGPWDRPYQRATFAARIPDCIRERRLKGDLTAYWSQLIVASLPVLRPFLLDGCLCSARVLDRRVMERALTPEALVWAPYTREVLWAATTEAWIRYWQGRVPDAPGAQRWDA
ncbi:MAG TPA: asparagine synthase-related protein, partial [Phenylobacterium sp.]|nr:asparagine synthase-related protein [Phenylobacterium sp.]